MPSSSPITITHHAALPELSQYRHILWVVRQSDLSKLAHYSAPDQLHHCRQRNTTKKANSCKPISCTRNNGALWQWLIISEESEHSDDDAFSRHTQIREALQPLLQEKPEQVLCAVPLAPEHQAAYHGWTQSLVFTLLANASPEITYQSPQKTPLSLQFPEPFLKQLHLYGFQGDTQTPKRLAYYNQLARHLAQQPPNLLTPQRYHEFILQFAQEHNWQHQSYSRQDLAQMGANAFVSVTDESPNSCIVHLKHQPLNPKLKISLVGKGVCFDTGGLNLKPSKYMQDMHQDMTGSAVALALIGLIDDSQLSIQVDAWMAIGDNQVGPNAMRPTEVISALNGTTIELVHTDAEGRLMLADTLCLATQTQSSDLLIDFATLTGSMQTALGTRYSGIFAQPAALHPLVIPTNHCSGERMCLFPQDADYDELLESKVADVQQCTLDSEADHILAVRFLSRFICSQQPWIHIDLSASQCKKGLGAIADETTGFGVTWTYHLLSKLLENPDQLKKLSKTQKNE